MGWSETWSDIVDGGNQRWRVAEVTHKKTALDHIVSHSAASPGTSLSILCPLAGDDAFVYYAWAQGHRVTAIDVVPLAVKQMRRQFDSDDGAGDDADWKREEVSVGAVVWRHVSGRANLYEGDVFKVLPALESFDAVYDKDAYGALDPAPRVDFSAGVAGALRPGGILYTEVKVKDASSPERYQGPPYHIEQSDLEKSFGATMDHVAHLGEIYSVSMGSVKQTAHILRRRT